MAMTRQLRHNRAWLKGNMDDDVRKQWLEETHWQLVIWLAMAWT